MATIQKTKIAKELQPAFEMLRDIREGIEADKPDAALAACERLAGILTDLEFQVGSVTRLALFE